MSMTVWKINLKVLIKIKTTSAEVLYNFEFFSEKQQLF